MFKTLYFKELRNYIFSLRFRISFIIVISALVVGTVSFLMSADEIREKYASYELGEFQRLEHGSRNISALATGTKSFELPPRDNAIMADGKEFSLPNKIRYNAYNVFNFSVKHDSVNPLLKKSETLTWGFIVSMFLSFVTLLFAFDAISGEKEDRTLALVFSNGVPRRTFLLAKLCSIVTVIGGMLLVGILLSMLILAFSGKVVMDISFVTEALLFLIFSVFLITLFAVFGLFSSAVTRSSNVSLLISLCFWLFAAVVVPNTSVFWANRLFPIPPADQVTAEMEAEKEDINRNAPEGSWSSWSGYPFFPGHELRARNQMNLMNAEKRHMDAYYNKMFGQFEKTRNFTLISPIAQYDYINEALLGGGYLRFRKNWDDLHTYQEQFLAWFKDLDARDDESPHWYNPYEEYSTSRMSVEIASIPVYLEQIAPFSERFRFVAGYLIAMVLMTALLFGATFYLFTRYDVR